MASSEDAAAAAAGVDIEVEVDEVVTNSEVTVENMENVNVENNTLDNLEEEMDQVEIHNETLAEPDPSPADTLEEEEEEIDQHQEDHDEEEKDDEDEEEENHHSAIFTNLPQGRVKKIMKICLSTNERDEIHEDHDHDNIRTNNKKKGKLGKGANKVNKNGNTNHIIMTKEAVFLTTVATELFVAAVAQQSSKITASNKKKTMTIDHLKRALADTESYEFLQGCFQPSIIIGD